MKPIKLDDTLTLSNGVGIPCLGFGTFNIDTGELQQCQQVKEMEN
jgi:diketogulonate reductase-like aldo/keto reductase